MDMMLVAAALTPAGWTLVGLILVVAGVALIAYTGTLPVYVARFPFLSSFINVITTIIGWSFIMIGGYFGLYGVFGEAAIKLYAVAFVLIWIAGIIVIVLYEVGILKMREEAYGGE